MIGLIVFYLVTMTWLSGDGTSCHYGGGTKGHRIFKWILMGLYTFGFFVLALKGLSK